MGIPIEQAENIKQNELVPASPDVPGASQVTRITESAADAWVEEVRGSLDYYFAQSGAARVSRIVLSGGGSQLGGLARRLAMTTGIPVEPAAPLAPMQIGKTGLSEAQLDYVQAFSVVPVGLAMAGAA
jgi:type IV pilus assembly protein PilM